MNKIINLRLNVIELFSLVIACICVSLSAYLYLNGISISMVKYILLAIGLLSEIVIITIELMLFIILKKKYKIIYMLYLILEITSVVILTKLIPFGGIISILPLSTIKLVNRLSLEKEIYNTKEFKRYCKMFNIKLPRNKVVKRVAINKKRTQATSKQAKSYA